MDNRINGIILIAAAAIMLALVLSFKFHVENLVMEEIKQNQGVCVIEGECLHKKNSMPVQTYGGIMAASLVFALGVYIVVTNRKREAEKGGAGHPKEEISREEAEKRIRLLNEYEKKVVSLLKGAEGTMFQSDLVEKSGFTKVKVTRILDVLEGKRLVERKRRGMTNVVILK